MSEEGSEANNRFGLADDLWLHTDGSFLHGGDKHPHMRELRILYGMPEVTVLLPIQPCLTPCHYAHAEDSTRLAVTPKAFGHCRHRERQDLHIGCLQNPSGVL